MFTKSHKMTLVMLAALFLSINVEARRETNEKCHPIKCKPCGPVANTCCKIKEGCVKIPARQTPQGLIPEAQLFFRMQGEHKKNKPVVLFVHITGSSSDQWLCQQQELCKHFCTLSLDLRGHGRSTQTPAKPSPDGINYTQEVFAHDIHELLKQLCIDKIIYVGNAMGGEIGIRYNSLYPGQICKLVLINSDPLRFLSDPTCAIGTFPNCSIAANCWQFPSLTTCSLLGLEQLIELIGFAGVLKLIIAPAFIYNESCQAELENAQNLYVETALILGETAFVNIILNTWSQDLRPLLSQIKIPTLIAYGSLDFSTPNGASVFMHNNIPNSLLVQFDGKGEAIGVTDFKTFNRVLTNFINNCPFSSFTEIPDEGCCVCPLVKPVVFVPCQPPTAAPHKQNLTNIPKMSNATLSRLLDAVKGFSGNPTYQRFESRFMRLEELLLQKSKQ